MQGLAPIDAWALIAILAKATGYATTLAALGGPLFLAIFPKAPADVRRVARQVTFWACIVGLAILLLRFGIRAGRLGGQGLGSMIDLTLLRIVWDSPLGLVAVLRAVGYVCALVAVKRQQLLPVGLLGAALLALSMTQIGHVSARPSPLGAVLILHIVMGGFWVAALWPLHAAAAIPAGQGLLRAFGAVATVVVGLLVVAGFALGWALIGGLAAGIGTAYGIILALKLLAVGGLIALAAGNKLHRVPALSTSPDAAAKLQMAIRWELGLVGVILLLTATVTTVTTPPINM